MSPSIRIAVKHVVAGLAAVLVGSVGWRLMAGSWPNLTGLGGFGVVLGMSVAWAAQDAFAAGVREGQQQGTGQPVSP